MGYTLHITRAADWTHGTTLPIDAKELAELGTWQDDMLEYQGLWLRLSEGNLELDNPTEEQILVLLDLARRLEARVLGDDGETYPLTPQPRTRPGWKDRLHYWWLKKTAPLPDSPFPPGSRARDVLTRQEVTVVSLEGGPLPTVTIRFADGRTCKRALHGCGLDPL